MTRGRVAAPDGTMNRLADALAEGLSVKDAAKAIHIDYAYANAVMQRMRRGLGPQAR